LTDAGRLGIGTTAPGNQNSAASQLVVGNTSANNGITILTGTSNDGVLNFNDGDNTSLRGYLIYEHSSDSLRFGSAGSERARIDSSGRLLVGTTTAYSDYIGADSGFTGIVNFVRNTGDGTAQFQNWSSSTGLDNVGGASIFISRCKSGTVGTHTGGALASGNPIGRIVFNASDGTNFRSSAYITAEVDGGVSTADVPGRLVFSTTADGSASPTSRFQIDSNGYFVYNQSTIGLYNLVTTSYNAASNTVIGIFGASNDTSVNNGAVYNIEFKMSGNSAGQFLYANYITRGGSRALGAYCTGTAWTNSSDIANKEKIIETHYGLSTVLAMRPVDFCWKNQKDDKGNGKLDVGFIAQEIEELIPEVVSGQEGSKGISYGNLVAVLTKAIQEQYEMITELQSKVAILEGK
jgi:hypothetical protein